MIEEFKQRIEIASGAEKTELLEKLLVLQTPRAAIAQATMDSHPRGYRDREKRLYELIDFNDTFVTAVLAQPQEQLASFVSRMQHAMKNFCTSQRTVMFSDEQLDAIVRGLSREIAVYLGAKREGLSVRMTSRTVDAFGIDMIITDRRTNAQLNVDCKAPSAFRRRLEDLEKEGRITTEQLLQADRNDYVTIMNDYHGKMIPVTILCVRSERLGKLVDFRFANTKPLGELLRSIPTA